MKMKNEMKTRTKKNENENEMKKETKKNENEK